MILASTFRFFPQQYLTAGQSETVLRRCGRAIAFCACAHFQATTDRLAPLHPVEIIRHQRDIRALYRPCVGSSLLSAIYFGIIGLNHQIIRRSRISSQTQSTTMSEDRYCFFQHIGIVRPTISNCCLSCSFSRLHRSHSCDSGLLYLRSGGCE